MATIVLTGKSGSSSSASSITLIPSSFTPIHIHHLSREPSKEWGCFTGQSQLQEQAAKAGYCSLEWHCYTCAPQTSYGTHQLKSWGHLQVPPRKQQVDSTRRVPATLWEVPQLQATAGTWRPRWGTAHTLPARSSPQIPSVPLTSDFTFFLGRVLGWLPKHTSFIVSASCYHHKDTWDGWRWGPTTEQIHIPGISQGTYNQYCLTGQYAQAKTGQEATQGASTAPHNSEELVPPSHVMYSSHSVKCRSLHRLFWILHQVHSGVKV